MRSWSVAVALLLGASAALAQEAPAPETPPQETPPAAGSAEERLRALEERLAALEGRPGPIAGKAGAEELEEEGGVARVVTALVKELRLTGLVSSSFTWNLADPPGRRDRNLLRVNDPDHDTFEVTYAKLGVYREVSGEDDWDAGFRVELAAGRLVETTLSLDPEFNGGDEINLANGYAVLQTPSPWGRPLTITAGRFYGWFGIESLDVPYNPNFSLSYFSNFTPFTNTGVGIGTEVVRGLRYTQYVVNGWDLVFDDNDAKSYGGQLTWTLEDPATTLAFNWLVGAELPDDEHDLRWLLELDLITRVTPTTEVRAALHYGQEEGTAIGGGVAKYGGAQAIVRQELHEVREDLRRFAVALRAGLWRDQGGSKSGLEQTLVDVTGTFEVRFTDFASLRLEWRHDQSNEAFFLGHRGKQSEHHQDTASAELNLRF